MHLCDMKPELWTDDLLCELEPRYAGPRGHGTRVVGEAVARHGARHFVYAMFGKGALIYIGSTRNPLGRFSGHVGKWWWPHVDYVEVFSIDRDEAWLARRAAGYAEHLLIQELDPIANVTGRKREVLRENQEHLARVLAER